MDKQIITFSANEQNLVRIGGEYHYSSNKVSYIGAHFDLGANWDGFDSVRAVWFTDRINGISTVLDGEGNCTVPTEVLKKKDRVFVNLVGSIVSNGELTDRLTTYPAVALVVDSKAKVDSTETAPVTPSQFEQFVSIVQDAVANIKDIVSTTLNADYTLTFVYSDGTSYTTPSIRGERGPQGADGADGTDGNGIASAVLNSNYTLTLTFTDGTSYTTPSIRGAQGPKGDPGDVSQAQLDAAVSDLKSALIYNIQPSFVKGAINGTTGVEQDANNYARSGYIYIDKAVNVHIDHSVHSTYRIYVYIYDEQKVYQSTSGIEYEYSLTNFTGYIRVALRDTSVSDLTDSDIADLKAALHIDVNSAVLSIGKLYDKTAENKNYIDSLVHYKVRTGTPYNLLTNVNFTANKYVDKDTGELKSNTGSYASDFIPIDSSYGYICKNTNVYNYYYDVANDSYHQTYDNSFERYQFAFYDINKVYITYVGAGAETSVAIPENAAFFRITLPNADAIKTARLIYGNEPNKPNLRQVEAQLKPDNNYLYHPITGYEKLNLVMFGDSITHGDLFIDNDGISYVDYAGDYLGTRLLNVGFGGTRMALAPNQSITGAYLFAFFNLCQVIVSEAADKWDALDDYATNTNTTYLSHLERLKAINWNEVHGICLMYGANDFTSGTPLGTAYNVDYNKFDGACAYGLNLLLTKYPHLQVIIFTPMYRQLTEGEIETDTDNAPNSAGLYMYQYGESLKNVSEVVHCPVVDLYHTVNINKYNRKVLMKDGTHPRTTLACKRMGKLFAEQIKQYVFPLI